MTSQKRHTVLLIDDSPEDRASYRRYLQRSTHHAFDVLEAESAAKGLEIYHTSHPDVILLDYLLPDMDGLELLQLLAQQEEKLSVPIIILTGQGDEVIATQVMKNGAQDYLVKGKLTADILCKSVAYTVQQFQLQQQLKRQQQQQQIVAEISLRIRQSLDLHEILQTAVDEVRRLLQTDRVIVFRFFPDWQGVVVVESCGADWTPILSTEICDPCFGETYAEPFKQGFVTAKSDIYAAGIRECHIELLANFQVRANLVVPIMERDELWGLLIAHHCVAPRQWQDTEIDLLRQISSQLSIALQQAALLERLQAELAERKQAEIALREKEQQLQQLSDSMPQFVWSSNAQGETEYVNRQWLEYSGLTVEQSRDPQKVAEFFHPEEAQIASEQWTIAQATQQPLEIEARLKRASDGMYRWFLIRSVPVLNEQGQVLRWYGTATDIHDRKVTQLSEQFLNDLDLRLRQLSDADAMVWEAISRIGEYLNVERCVWHEVSVPEDLAIVTQDWRRDPNISSVVGVTRLSESILPDMITQFNAGQPAVVPDVATHPYTAPFAQNFAKRDIRAFVGIPCLYEGRWVAVLAINARTVQEWRSEQVALLQKVVARLWSLIEQTRAVQAQQKLVSLIENSSDFIGIATLDGQGAFLNQAGLDLVGLETLDDVRQRHILEYLFPEDHAFVQEQVLPTIMAGEQWQGEFRFRHFQTGAAIWVWWNVFPLRNPQTGQVNSIATVTRDIRDRKEAMDRIQASEERFRRLVANVPGAIYQYVVHPDGSDELTYISPQCREIYEYETEVLQQNFSLAWQIVHPEDVERVSAAVAASAENLELLNVEFRLLPASGKLRWVQTSSTPTRLSNGDTTWDGIVTDITDRKQTEQALQEREAILQLFAQYAPAGIAMFDREMCYVMASQRWTEDYNQGSLASMIGRSIYDLFPDLPERWRQVHQRCLAGAIEKCDEDLFVWADGRQQWIRWETRPWYAATDEIGGIIIFAEDITQRKQSESTILQLNQELQQKVTELQTLLEVIPIGIGIADDPECQHIRVNPAFADALGIPPTVNASLSAPEEERPNTFKVYQNGREMAPEELPLQYAAAHNVELRDLEVDVVWQNGTTVTLLEYAAPLLDESGHPRGSVGAFLNITDRKRAEQALRDSEQQLTLALQAAKAGAWTWELATNRLYWSDEYYRVFGLEPGSVEPSYENGFSRLHPDDQGWVEQEVAAAIAQGNNTNVEYRILLPDGSSRWVIGMGQMFYDELNQPARMAGIVVDITERKQAEAALRESQERYRTLAQNFPNGAVVLFDNDLRYVLVEGQGLAQVGLDKTSLEGKTIWEVLDAETCRLLEPLYREALSGHAQTMEIPFGDRIYSVHCLPVFDNQGFVRLGMLMSQDITLQKQAEQVLRTARDELERQVQERTRELQEANILLAQREREFRTLVENTPDVITRHDCQHRCLYINPACIQSLGMPPEFFVGKKPSELGYPEDLAQFWETSLATVLSEGEMQIDEFIAMNGDEPRSYQVYVVPEREVDQSIVSVMTIGRDITQLRQAEEFTRQLAEELQRSNQELEQFAYVASHDLQEPLRAITSFTQLLAKEYREQLDDDADMYIEFIVDGATRMQQLIRDLLTYSRVGRYELQLQPVDCNALLERVKKDLQVAIAENQAIITTDPLPTIMADPNQMANLLQNLIGNSLKYRSEADPRIHISARRHIVEAINDLSHSGSSHLTMRPEGWLFSFQDNGIGIEPQYAERIFGIFQRLHTSDEYSGTGLGLAICQKIIERHQGRIWVESQLGQGATFFFTIPTSIKTHHDNSPPITQNPAG